MATTSYVITAQNVEGEFDVIATKSKKAQALELAEKFRFENKRTTQVHTSAGTLVGEFKARKPQKKTAQYTRVVELPEGFKVPEGKRVAYLRTRKSCAILHDFDEQYWVYDLKTNDVLGSFGTTRQCGRFLADVVRLDDEGNVVLQDA